MACPHAIQRTSDGVMVRSHALVRQVALDDETYSSRASRFLQVPNGMDGHEHNQYRALTDRYLTPERVNDLIPTFAHIAERVVADAIDRGGITEAVGLGAQFSVRSSCAWLGWPQNLEAELIDWVRANWEASASQQFSRTAAVAAWYNAIIQSLIKTRETEPADDVTSELMNDEFLGRPLSQEEITSILRNWTGGDLGSMALCIGVVLAYLADEEELQHMLRHGEVSTSEWHAVLDEILRIDDPFIANRRVATTDTVLGGTPVKAGERLLLNWTSANQDESVFKEFDPLRNAEHNLVYGIGRHVCPGRLLATEQLRIFTQAILNRTLSITPAAIPRERSLPPAGGFIRVPLILTTA